jgi:sterol desaturase/sphingolipid hydroxylase (fatty acid hydroxylase superfamily)
VDALVFNTVNAVGLTLLVGLELRSQTFREVLRDRRRMRRNLAFLLLSFAVGVLIHRSLGWLSLHVPQLSWRGPFWLQLAGVFLLGELLNWALHFAKHHSAFLWRLHCPHHKEDKFTVWLTVHTYGPEILLSGIAINAIILSLGFEVAAIDVYLLFYSLVNAYQHSSRPHSLGWLDRLIVSPAYHRHHHGGEQLNFGSTLTVWDLVFQTALLPRDRYEAVQPPSIDETPEPFGFVAELLYPWRPSRWVESRPPDLSQRHLAE